MIPNRKRPRPGPRARWVAGSLALVALVAVGACESSVGLAGEGQGRLTVLLTDAPFPFELVAEANVTIERVEAVPAGSESAAGDEGGVVMLAEGEQTFNLLELQDGVTASLGSAVIESGAYSQIRLIVSDAWVVLVDEDETDDVPGQRFDLAVPSGARTGLKILVSRMEVEEGAETTVTLDFDVSDSFIVQGDPDTPAGIRGFLLRPVVKAKRVEVDGESVAVAGSDDDGTEGEGEEGEGEEGEGEGGGGGEGG